MVQAYVRLVLNLCYVHMLAQVNDRESNAPYEHVLCPARMHFPYGLRTDHRRLQPQGQYSHTGHCLTYSLYVTSMEKHVQKQTN